MMPSTDIERIFFVLLINAGDVLFALAFGLIAQITMRSRMEENEAVMFIDQMILTERTMDEFKSSESLKSRVEKFQAFSFYAKQTLIWQTDLSEGKIPKGLGQDILWYTWRGLLEKMFGEFGSQNFIKDVAQVLEIKIFMPGDYVLKAGNIEKQMWFIVQGSV